MKKVAYLLILIVVLFACNRNTRERNSETEICEYEHSIINPELLRMARWAKTKNELDNFHRGIFYIVDLAQPNDSNFVRIISTVFPPVPPPPPPPPPPLHPNIQPSPPFELYYPYLIGFTHLRRSGLTEEDEEWIAKMNETERLVFAYDSFVFFGKNISDDFLASMVQYDALSTCHERLFSLGNYLDCFSFIPPFAGFVFFVNEQGHFILKRTFPIR